MPLDDTLIQIAGIVLAIAAYLIFVAYFMASNGEFNDTRFGRAVFYTGIPAWLGLALAYQLGPETLRRLDVQFVDLVILAAVVIAVAGLVGAIADAVAWLRGDDRPPAPPFQS